MLPGPPSSVTTDRPAAAQASMPPSTLIGSKPSRAKNSATFADRPPALQMTYSVADRSISSSRAGTWPIGMCFAVAAWPRCHSSSSRTTSNTVFGPNSAGSSPMVVWAIGGSELTPSILACPGELREDRRPAKTGYTQFPQVYPQAAPAAISAFRHGYAAARARQLWITRDRNRIVIDSPTRGSANS